MPGRAGLSPSWHSNELKFSFGESWNHFVKEVFMIKWVWKGTTLYWWKCVTLYYRKCAILQCITLYYTILIYITESVLYFVTHYIVEGVVVGGGCVCCVVLCVMLCTLCGIMCYVVYTVWYCVLCCVHCVVLCGGCGGGKVVCTTVLMYSVLHCITLILILVLFWY